MSEVEEKCLKLIETAMSHVRENYFQITLPSKAGRKLVKRRERVYCYELYHQMRCLQEGLYNQNGQDYKLGECIVINGEIDKRNHPIIVQGFNPDFVIHKQGYTTDNLCVIEVKTDLTFDGTKKDFNTITCMLNCYEYKLGVFIITGGEEARIKRVICDVYKKIKCLPRQAEKIYVLIQEKPDEAIKKHNLKKWISECEETNVCSNL